MNITSSARGRFDPTTIRLPLIALIDVVLFLLFYFVISYSISKEEAELSTGFARPGQSMAAMEPQVLMVSMVNDAPEYRMGLRVFSDRASLIEMLRALPKEPGVVVKATSSTPVWATVGAVQASKDAGFENVRFAVSTH
jgi:biopolymer transport protein ExbD